jgi:hypothetical protein
LISSYECGRKSLGKPEDSHENHSRIADSPVLIQVKNVNFMRVDTVVWLLQISLMTLNILKALPLTDREGP